ncbi:MAG: asparagine synthase [Phormidesmis sp. CAN_BIN36]|nr:asparagine synthase [Phormidesmis sp. CAN_BIN36]
MLGRPYQFVGGWRMSNASRHHDLQDCLSQIVEADQKCLIKKSSDWAIAYLGADGLLDESAIVLSACGRSDHRDIWVNLETEELRLGRDRFGRVPLYWICVDQVIWFATQLRLLLPLVESPKVNISALYGYSCFSYVPTPLTSIEQISSVPAGVELVWKDHSNPITQPYDDQLLWQESNDLIHDEASAIAQLQDLLKDAIADQTRDLSDEPVGVFLSGGIDSSIVAALLVQAGLKVRAYALDFGGEGYSELPYAQLVADYLQIPLVRVSATPQQLIGVLRETARSLDAPYGDGVTAPLFLLNQAAAQETRVVFNGENGDQLFAGWVNKPLIASAVYNSENPAGTEAFNRQYLRTFQRFYGYEARVFSPEVYQQIRAIDLQDYLRPALGSDSSLLARLRRASLMLKGAQNIQPRATALGFAHGLWVRSPFCDPALTQWTFRLPGELVLQGACEKYILKRAVESWLPPEIVWREKRGMGVPLRPGYYQNLWSEVGNWLNPGVLKREGRWQPYLAEQMMSGELGVAMRDRYLGNNLWLLLMWQAWRIEVLGEQAGARSWNHPFWLPPWLGRQMWSLKRRSQE